MAYGLVDSQVVFKFYPGYLTFVCLFIIISPLRRRGGGGSFSLKVSLQSRLTRGRRTSQSAATVRSTAALAAIAAPDVDSHVKSTVFHQKEERGRENVERAAGSSDHTGRIFDIKGVILFKLFNLSHENVASLSYFMLITNHVGFNPNLGPFLPSARRSTVAKSQAVRRSG